ETKPVIYFYDIQNVYAPQLINRFDNPSGIALTDVHIAGDNWVSVTNNTLYSSAVRGNNVHETQLPTTLLDVGYDQEGLWGLYDDRVEFRRYDELELVTQVFEHSLIAPKSIAVSEQRLLLRSATEVELLNAPVLKRGGNAVIGKALLNQDDAVLNGELLTVLTRSAQRLSVYDVNQNGQQLNLKLLSDIRATGINNLQQITSHDDLLEWRMNNRYFNTRLPFNNLWNVQPNHIGAEAAMLAGRVAGA